MHEVKRGIMAKTAIGLFNNSPTADKVVARLLKSGFSRDELRLVRRVDFDGDAETEILKIAALLKDDACRYWEAVRRGRVLVSATAGGDTADRAAIIMDEEGAINMEERTLQPVKSGGARVASSADPGLYPQRPAAQLFEVS